MSKRKRLTAATLDDGRKMAAALEATDLATRILGSSATDTELVTAGSILLKGLGPKGITAMNKKARSICAELGEDYPGPDEEGDQSECRDTEQYATEHELSPDKSVLDTVLNKKSPTQDPTASKKTASDDEDDDPEMPEMEEPEEVEGMDDDYVDEDDDDDWDEEDDMDDDYEDGYDDEFDMDGSDETAEWTEMEDDIDQEAYYDDYEDDDREFTMEDAEELEDLGFDGVMVASKDSKKSRKASKIQKAKSNRPSRVRKASSPQVNEFNQVFDVPDTGDTFLY
jgi:hypothetical protein